jgi:hypothetical protein
MPGNSGIGSTVWNAGDARKIGNVEKPETPD